MKKDPTGKLAKEWRRNPIGFFNEAARPARQRGGGSLPKKYRTALTALGGLRTFMQVMWNVRHANAMGNERGQSSWDKYEFFAGRMMMSLQSIWLTSTTILDAYQLVDVKTRSTSNGLIAPPESLDDSRTKKIIAVRKFVKKDFTLSSIKLVGPDFDSYFKRGPKV